jgi:hypothetical protein
MPAPKGNSFWKLRSKHGRDKIFSSPQVFLEAAYEYFEKCDNAPWNKMEVVKTGKDAGKLLPVPTQKPYTIQGMCVFLHITEQTFLNYEKNESYKDFFEVFTHVRDIIENNQFEGATVGAYNANIIARKLGIADKQESNVSGSVNIINLGDGKKPE